ncbi:cyclic AMP-dependent transcription factor ATF-4-like [Solea senegalensis]|uniref:Cyclic AMP-dependent transcription factor ATF-4-like n=1 Tax=Solea senegalensis TaxID=28829 RepID=A0AAV6Q9Z1_SOLSE|nr:cyclic AMP-dependent transcription factor ATF-4 isoform X2 [Solea senegalensis]KAG7485659.1 cyclic AMP-dependent transcription factor ATF-4-like [Solea senegalensis]
MTLSQCAMEDVEALCLEPSFQTADPMGALLDQVKEEALSPSSSLEGKAPASPSPSYSSYASSLSPYWALSPLPSPSAAYPSSFLETKDGADSFPCLVASNLLDASVGADDGNVDAFGMDWILEKHDLSELYLNSLIESCSADGSLSSPEALLASLDSHMDLDLESYDATISASQESLELSLSLPGVPALPLVVPLLEVSEAKETEVAPDQEVDMKLEPPSPAPSPSPPSPTFTLEPKSEGDEEKVAQSLTATVIPDSSGNLQATESIISSLPTSAQLVVVVVTNKDEPPLVSLPESPSKSSSPSSDCDDDSGFESWAGSPPSTPSSAAGSSRTKPYTKPEPASASSPSSKASKVKSVSGAPKVVEKKLKKMEQNKTAATRYRQKKRVEQDLLNDECLDLEKRNQELAEKAESISREIKYLKDLMEEVRKRRNKTSSVA